MTEMQHAVPASSGKAQAHSAVVLLRSTVIGLTAFLTVVDLFATQAILPSLARHYGVMPAAIGFAVNACTLGMAVSGLAVGYFSREIDRRKGILISLVLLARERSQPHGVHRSARGAGAVHGVGLYPHARLSR